MTQAIAVPIKIFIYLTISYDLLALDLVDTVMVQGPKPVAEKRRYSAKFFYCADLMKENLSLCGDMTSG
ncbi:MAG: hypothetical protein ABIP64_07695 [Burkholderiales bacterium]